MFAKLICRECPLVDGCLVIALECCYMAPEIELARMLPLLS
jgi:hypothetical protein